MKIKIEKDNIIKTVSENILPFYISLGWKEVKEDNKFKIGK